jgi:hypothetical protein
VTLPVARQVDTGPKSRQDWTVGRPKGRTAEVRIRFYRIQARYRRLVTLVDELVDLPESEPDDVPECLAPVEATEPAVEDTPEHG